MLGETVTIQFPQVVVGGSQTNDMSSWSPEFAYQYGLYQGSNQGSSGGISQWANKVAADLRIPVTVLGIFGGLALAALFLNKR